MSTPFRKKTVYALLALLGAMVVIMTVNTLRSSLRKTEGLVPRTILQTDTSAAYHLQQAVHIESVSYEDSASAGLPQLDTLIGFLKSTYPDVFRQLEVEQLGGHSLLLKWSGGSASLKPILLYAHMDVVPVENGAKSGWRFPPFSAPYDADTIRGRGCVDDKAGVIGILEGIHRLLKKGFAPKRTIYIAFGHDEEVGGDKGARVIAQTLKSRGIRLEWILDEGGLVAVNMVPFVKPPVALVMTAEKGYMTVEISADGKGGHSSFPPPETPTDIITAALKRIHDQPFKKKIIPSLDGFMERTGPEMRFPFNVLFSNRWIFGGIILNEYEKIPEANAMIRTTAACTILQGGVKENVIPSHVKALLNIRLLPGDRSDDVFVELKNIVHDERVTLKVLGRKDEASPNSSMLSEGYRRIEACAREVFPDAIVAPSISIAATDSHFFYDIADDIYRFLPVRMDRSILSGMHGTNERIGTVDFMETIRFYERLMESQ